MLSFPHISRSPIEWLFEKFEWNADHHGSDRFSLVAFCGVQSLHAWIDAVSSPPPLEENPC
ncbi:MAG: hypothetical protein DWQ34_21060 [Planctomycetota bacterium]|nr:MAG: hypothetical protein DWQ29_22030 [Planctomycetota bacterium]REJ88879.1 MAG: hypothetical protein DWQ34_21060 [Planctomycetota bacterium]